MSFRVQLPNSHGCMKSTFWKDFIPVGFRVTYPFGFLLVGVTFLTADVPETRQPDVISPPSVEFQSPGTRKMAQRLSELGNAPNPTILSYSSGRQVDTLIRQLEQTANQSRQVQLRYDLGNQLLLMGRAEEAVAEFKAVEDAITARGNPMEPRDRVDLRMHKITAYLRLGERENCLANHNSESCRFPLRPEAFHRLPRGSRGAIQLLNEQLTEFPRDLAAVWLLNIAHMTLGEYPEKVPEAWRIPPRVFASEFPMPRFPEVAGALGLDADSLAGGVIIDDFNRDGFLDVVTSSWNLAGQLRYFENNGHGSFTERTREAGLIGITGGLNIQQTDYNNDGWPDIWVLRGAWLGAKGRFPRSLLRNNQDGTFSDVTEESGLLTFHPTQASVWFDYDGDGWLDLFVGNETPDPKDPDPCELFHNNRNGTFTDCASKCGLALERFVKGVVSADYDQDGRPDLYLTTKSGGNLLFHNEGPAETGSSINGTWRFSDTTLKAGVAEPASSFATWFFDYDNDGWDDLFVSGYSFKNVGDVAADYLKLPHSGVLPKLYHNNHDGTFTDVTVATRLNRLFLTMGCNYGDLDNDGWLDFYLGQGDPDLNTVIPNRMFRNSEGHFFQDVTTSGGFGHLQKGHAVAFADLDNNGSQDVYIVLGGAYPGDNYRKALFLNPGNTNHWVKLKLEGVQSSRAAIGARIRVDAITPGGVRSFFRTVSSGGSFGSSPLMQQVGLANAREISRVEVVWQGSGLRQVFTRLELDTAYLLKEGAESAVRMDLKPVRFDLTARPRSGH